MRFLLRMSALTALALLSFTGLSAVAQEESSPEVVIELDPERIQELIESNGKEIEAWADKHAKEWESWAEQFESKMERWAESQESNMEEWGESYAKRWEEWAAKMESGDFDPDEMKELLEQNLKMINEMPLKSLIESGLQEGLGELKNAPFESLNELHELIGGTLEQSLRAMEKELHDQLPENLTSKLQHMQTAELHSALAKLQKSIDAKHLGLEKNATKQITHLKELLKKASGLEVDQQAKLFEAVEREWVEAKLLKEQINSKQANAAFNRARELQNSLAEKSVVEASKLREATERMLVEQHALDASQKAMASSKKSLGRYYEELKRKKSELNSKDSEIEIMRREISLLRKEVEAMKRKKQEDDN